MRRRLTSAILTLVAGTLVLAALGSAFLVHRASATTAEQQLYAQAHALADYQHPQVFLHSIRVVKYVGQYDALTIVGLSAVGTFTSDLPTPLRRVDLDPAQLHRGLAIGGTAGDIVYVLIPLSLTTTQKSQLAHPVPYEDTAVLVATRTLAPPVGGIGYFLLIGLGCLIVATLVAYGLARRFSRPLVVAAQATERIAAGDLTAPIPTGSFDIPEFATLATAINEMSDRLQRARDQQRQFFLSVSHELRTPLTSIRGYAEALTDGAADDPEGAIRIIDAEARRLERLVRDLLDLARLEATRFGFQVGPVDVADVVHGVVRHLRPEAQRLGVGLRSTLVPGEALRVQADEDRLYQVLTNLVENALSFARSGVDIGAGHERDRVLMWVDDDGPGIPAPDLPRVFEPHFTSDRTLRRRPGTGLGLAIVSELTSAMGGGVRAESPRTAEGGTRMVVWLPAQATGEGMPPPTGGPGPGSGQR